MSRSAGIVTATGGFASHAAVVARGWGIPAVVGAADVSVGVAGVVVDGRELAAGTVISIDGSTGEVLEGVAAGVEVVAPEVAVLLGWANELGIAIGGDEATVAPAGPVAGEGPGPDDVLRALLIRGYGTPDALAPAIGGSVEAAASLVDALVADGRVEPGAGSFRLTASGREAAIGLLAADREAWGDEAAAAALDAFLDLDRRMKDVVTAWQMTGPETVNDHGDPDYDAAVMARLAELHRDVEAWLEPLTAGLPRLARYGERLGAAAAAVASGNGRYIASPRVDCYHGAWFELHEDLIQLAGRTRADEVAAGRA